MRNSRLAVAIGLMLGFSACGKADLTGHYTGSANGTLNGANASATIDMTTVESNGNLAGDIRFTTNSNIVFFGTLTATTDGSTVNGFQIVVPSTEPCPGTLNATGSFGNNQLVGNMNGTLAGSCGAFNMNYSINKQ